MKGSNFIKVGMVVCVMLGFFSLDAANSPECGKTTFY
jgi:hypothetical protein